MFLLPRSFVRLIELILINQRLSECLERRSRLTEFHHFIRSSYSSIPAVRAEPAGGYDELGILKLL